jgi:hypothetical protein
LKNWLHRDFSRSDKILLVLGSFDTPCSVRDIIGRAINAGVRAPAKWNVSTVLARTQGLAIKTPSGWELTEAGKQHLRTLGVETIKPSATKVATDLRALLSTITEPETSAFVAEAVQCYELELYRSAVVMSWLAAVHVLKVEVVNNHLAAFNAEAQRIDPKWKMAKTTDDLGLMKEVDFLDRLAGLSIIGKNVKTELKNCLDRRNACGHPNSYRIGPNAVTHHIETLLQNVFQRFC